MEMQENNTQSQHLTQNIHMMRSKLHKYVPSVSIATWSGITTVEDKGKQPQKTLWVWKAADKEDWFDVNKVKEPFMEAKKSFRYVGASTSKAQSSHMEKLGEISTV